MWVIRVLLRCFFIVVVGGGGGGGGGGVNVFYIRGLEL